MTKKAEGVVHVRDCRPDEEVLSQLVAIECAQANVLDLVARAEATALKAVKGHPDPLTELKSEALGESWTARYALRDAKALVRTAHEEVKAALRLAAYAVEVWDAAVNEPPKPEPEKFEIDLGEGVQLVVEVVRSTQGEKEPI